MASSFADPADIAAFKRAKARGLSDQQAFRYGDNGIGKWGQSTVQGTGPSCALPPEDWQALPHQPQGTKVKVTVRGRFVICELSDTMPGRSAIENGAGIDLNPDACAALGLVPPILVPATWQWV